MASSSEQRSTGADGPPAGGPPVPIAVIGLGCRLPGGASSPEALWQLLVNRVDAVVEAPAERWSNRRFHERDADVPGRMLTTQGGFLRERIEAFDAGFFGFSAREAAQIDPQQRLLLETTWEALERAGLDVARLRGSRTGVFTGGFCTDALLQRLGADNRHLIDAFTATGVTLTMLANRLSHTFDFRGPSLSLDTACSSSLVAVHLACTSLWRGECTLAVAGGANVMLRPEYTIAMSKGGFLSPQGRCFTFDERASGYVRAEGAAVVVLKPLPAALAAGDPIWAVIRASGVNQDGRTPAITQPSPDAQQTLMREVYAAAGVAPRSVAYVEAHGTGTQAGDAAEAQSLAAVLGAGRAAAAPCAVGSLKSNLGHLEAVAGVAGLIKAVLVLAHRRIPPNVHFERPNPKIDFALSGLRVPTTLEPLPMNADGRAFAAVNSFGYGGTNAHVLLETAPERTAPSATSAGSAAPLLPLSAADPAALRALAGELASGLSAANPEAWRDVRYTAAHRRSHLAQRLVVLAPDAANAAEQLRNFAGEQPAPGCVSGQVLSPAARLAFVFTGMGPQVWGMGRGAYAAEPVFRAAFDRVADGFASRAGIDIAAVLGHPDAGAPITDPVLASVANFALQVALAGLWQSWGVTPAAIVGHSTGEVAAAYVAGALSLEDAVDVCHHRSRLQQRLRGTGGMLAVGLGEEAVRPLLATEPEVCFAALNAPGTVTLAGPSAALDRLSAALGPGVFQRRLKVDIPYHGLAMRTLAAEITAGLARLRPRPTTLPLVSSVTGEPVAAELPLGPDYWVRNVAEPVRFAAACRSLVATGVTAFLEIGPHPVLAESLQQNLAAARVPGVTLASLRRDVPDAEQLHRTLATLYVHGLPLAWEAVIPAVGRIVPFPSYPWQRQSLWLESQRGREDRVGRGRHPFVDVRRAAPRPTWEIETGRGYLPYLEDHRIGSTVVFPGAGYLEAALVAHEEEFGTVPCILEAVRFERMLVLDPKRPAVLVTEYDPGRRRCRIHALSDREHGAWTTHAELAIHHLTEPPEPKLLVPPRLANAHRSSPTEVYRLLEARGLQYGPWFRTIRSVEATADEAIVHLRGHPQLAGSRSDVAHPTLVDGVLQALVALIRADDAAAAYVPTAIARVVCHGRVRRDSIAHLRIRAASPGRVLADVQLADTAGNVALELLGLELRALAGEAGEPAAADRYVPAWRDAPLTAARAPGVCWVGGGRADARAAVVTALRADNWACVETIEALPADGLVVYLGEPPARDTFETAFDSTRALLALAQQCASRPGLRLLLVTPGCQIVTGREPRTALTQLPWSGFAGVVANEGLVREARTVDLDPSALGDAGRVVMAEARADAGDRNVAWRNGGRWAQEWRRAALRHDEGAARVSPAGTYLVTGGTRGFGLELARWLLCEGAGRVVLASRAGPEAPGLATALAELGAAAERVEVVAADIADEASATALVRRLAAERLPLRGVFHGAMVLEDGRVAEQTPERLRRVLWPKLGGALRLHRLTQETPLDWFVCLSSVSAVLGNPGQSTYAAANAFLDGLVQYRRRHGLPGTVIDLGLLGEAGVAHGQSELQDRLARVGIAPLATADALRGIRAALAAGVPQLGVFRVDWERWQRAFPAAAGDRRFQGILHPDAGAAALERGAAGLRQLAPEQQVEAVIAALRTHLGPALRTPADRLSDSGNLLELGIDSLGLIELVATINRLFGVQLTSAELLRNPTLRGLAGLVRAKLGLAAPA